MATIEVRAAADRFRTRLDWLDSRHSFSFGRHYDPRNTHFGLLLASNDDLVAPGAGFDTHPHRDVEIVTWMLDGVLVHRDSAGHTGRIYPGLAQRMSAGSGIRHSETNDGVRLSGGAEHRAPARFVQMWVAPDEAGRPPEYEQRDVTAQLSGGGLVTVASGMARHAGGAAIRIRQPNAALHAARLVAGGSIVLPAAPYLHVYVARGRVELAGAPPLGDGDAARVTAGGGQRVVAAATAEVLVWEMHATLRAPGGGGREGAAGGR